MEIQNVKGTKDLFDKEAEMFEYVESLMKAIAGTYGFKDMRPPVLEHSEVFSRAVGESSDVVRKEMYTFLDKGNRSLTLRPEFTAGIMRLIVQNKLYATMDLPIKAYYHGPVFRYERPQLGRYRQFNQFGVESVGVNSYFHDVEVILLGYVILLNLGFTGVTLKINTLGDDESRMNYKNALKEYFKDKIGDMCEDCKQRYELNPLRILDCKVPADQEIVKDAPKMSDYLSETSRERFNNVLKELDESGVTYEVDDTLVRGLDYYSETVFEFHFVSNKGINYGAIGAGGHYDKLVKEMGGPSLEGVGFSFGLERVVSIMQDNELFDELNINKGLDVYVIPMDPLFNSNALDVALMLRSNGYSVEVNYEGGKVASIIKRANRKNTRLAIFIGEEEIKSESLSVKDLKNNTQDNVALDDLLDYVDDIFNENVCDCQNGNCQCKNN